MKATIAQLEENGLQLYRIPNGYLLANDKDNVVVYFTENLSHSDTSMRISMKKESKIPIEYSCKVTDIKNASKIEIDTLGAAFISFIYKCYLNACDSTNSTTYILERTSMIRREYKNIPWEICRMLAEIPIQKNVAECIRDLLMVKASLEQPPYEYHSVLSNGSKREKRNAFAELLSRKTYECLKLNERSSAYLDSIAKFLVNK